MMNWQRGQAFLAGDGDNGGTCATEISSSLNGRFSREVSHDGGGLVCIYQRLSMGP